MKLKNGKFSGKGQTVLGYMTAYMLAGVNVMRSIPTSVKTSDSQNASDSRLRFKALSGIVKNMSPVLAMRTMPINEGENFRNPATRENSQAVTLSAPGVVKVTPADFVWSKGGFANQPATGTYNSSTQKFEVSWTASTAVGASPDDKVYLVIAGKNAEILTALEEDARSAGGLASSVSALPSGSTCYAFLLVKSIRSNNWANSQYLGTFTT